MSKDLNIWLDNAAEDIESVQFKRKSSTPRCASMWHPKHCRRLLELLQGHASYVHLSAITCVDWIEEDEFELVYHVWSYETRSLVSAHTRIPRDPGVYLSDLRPVSAGGFFRTRYPRNVRRLFRGQPGHGEIHSHRMERAAAHAQGVRLPRPS